MTHTVLKVTCPSVTPTTCQSTDPQPITGLFSSFHPNHLSKYWPPTNHRPGLILSPKPPVKALTPTNHRRGPILSPKPPVKVLTPNQSQAGPILSPKPPVKVLTPNQSQACSHPFTQTTCQSTDRQPITGWSHPFTQTTCQSTDRQPITGLVSFFHPNHLSKHWPPTNHRRGLILSPKPPVKALTDNQSQAWSHSFFIQHQIPHWMGVCPSMMTLWCQYNRV